MTKTNPKKTVRKVKHLEPLQESAKAVVETRKALANCERDELIKKKIYQNAQDKTKVAFIASKKAIEKHGDDLREVL